MELVYNLICGDVGVRIRKERETQLSCVPVVVFRGEADLKPQEMLSSANHCVFTTKNKKSMYENKK